MSKVKPEDTANRIEKAVREVNIVMNAVGVIHRQGILTKKAFRYGWVDNIVDKCSAKHNVNPSHIKTVGGWDDEFTKSLLKT